MPSMVDRWARVALVDLSAEADSLPYVIINRITNMIMIAPAEI